MNKIIYVNNLKEYKHVISILKKEYILEDEDNECALIYLKDEEPLSVYVKKHFNQVPKISVCGYCKICFTGCSESLKEKITYNQFIKEDREMKLKRILK